MSEQAQVATPEEQVQELVNRLNGAQRIITALENQRNRALAEAAQLDAQNADLREGVEALQKQVQELLGQVAAGQKEPS